MNESDLALLKSSLILLVAGMGMTFIFLLVQVLCTNISSKITARFAYLLPEPVPKKPTAKPVAKPQADEDEIVAAMAAAIHHASKG